MLSFALALPVLAAPLSLIHALEVSSPRDYGIVMGETLLGEIRVRTAAGLELETASLPQPGSAVNDYLEVRAIQSDRQTLGEETLYRITLTYQVFKGVREAETLAVPALPLRFHHYGEIVETTAPSWNFTLTPIIPAKTADEAVVLRASLPAPDNSSASHWRWLLAFLAGLAGLGIYSAWRLGLAPFRRHIPPFARAASELKILVRQAGTLANYRQGAKLLHDALNETAGHTLFYGQLPHWLETRPEYAGSKAELEQFFSVSERIFFMADTEYPADYPLSRVENLCRKLASAYSVFS